MPSGSWRTGWPPGRATPMPRSSPLPAAAGAAGASRPADAPAAGAPGADSSSSSSTGPPPEGTTLPPVDQFVLSKAQLKFVTEKHGLDFEELLTGLQGRGIPLSD